MRRIVTCAITGLFLVLGSINTPAQATPEANRLAEQLCHTLAERVAAVSDTQPVFLRSYDDGRGQGPSTQPALTTAAFVYDNALAAIALAACHADRAAQQIADGLLLATQSPPLRNAYRAGPVTANPPPNGWYDSTQHQWFEDDYQTGTATGNVAWAGLALLTVFEQTHQDRYRRAAADLGHWVLANAIRPQGTAQIQDGFRGGWQRHLGKDEPLTWVSTEHNADLAALFARLAADGADGPWSMAEKAALAFVASQWDPEQHHFTTGLLPDGKTPNRALIPLDAQTFPLLLNAHPSDWNQALNALRHSHGVGPGFDFNDDRDGIWTEGTAQVWLVAQEQGDAAIAGPIASYLAKQRSPGGYLWATNNPSLTTGLAIGPDSKNADFLYFRWPHLGATSWAILAATGWNPYRGKLTVEPQ